MGHELKVKILSYHQAKAAVFNPPDLAVEADPAEIDYEINSGHPLLDKILMDDEYIKEEIEELVYHAVKAESDNAKRETYIDHMEHTY